MPLDMGSELGNARNGWPIVTTYQAILEIQKTCPHVFKIPTEERMNKHVAAVGVFTMISVGGTINFAYSSGICIQKICSYSLNESGPRVPGYPITFINAPITASTSADLGPLDSLKIR